MRPLSYTQINRYQTCPLSYKLQYIDRLKAKPKFYLSFGDVVHQCAEYFFKVPAPPPPTLERLLQFYKRVWLSDGYESTEQEQQYKDFGRKLLEDFWKLHHPNFRMPLAVEYQFSINIDGVMLGGKIDRVDRLPDGGVSIVDYKTNQNLFSAEYLDKDLQLTFYQLAVETCWKLPVKQLTLYHLRSNIPFTCVGRPPERLQEAREIVLSVADGITRKIFPAKENQFCDWCDFHEHCPYRAQKYAAEQPPRLETQDILQGKAPGEIIERYAALQEQKKGIEDELEELKKTICAYCETHGYNRIFGQEHAVTYKMVDRSSFDENKVKAALLPVGLWPQVLKFDPSLAKALLDDKDALKPELRKKLENARKVTTTFPQLFVKKVGEE